MPNETEQLREEIEKLKIDLSSINNKLNEAERYIEQNKPKIDTIETRLMERDKIEEEYLLGKKISGTTSASAGTQTSHPHYLGRTPSFVFITPKSNGTIYVSATADKTNIYVKGSDPSLDFDAYVLI